MIITRYFLIISLSVSFCLLNSQSSFAQNTVNDSLKVIIKELKDSATIYGERDMNEPLTKAAKWIQQVSDSSVHFEYYRTIGIYHLRKRNFEEALKALQEALNLVDYGPNPSENVCGIYKYLGYSTRELSIFNRAISYMEQAISCTRQNDDLLVEGAHLSLSLFNLLYDISKYEDAIDLAKKLPSLFDRAQLPTENYVELYINLAHCYMYINQYPQANLSIQKAETLFQEIKDDKLDFLEVRLRSVRISYIIATEEGGSDELIKYMDKWANNFNHEKSTRGDRIAFYYRQAGYRAMAYQYEKALEAADSMAALNSVRDKDGKLIVPEIYHLKNSVYYNIVRAEIALRQYLISKDTSLLPKSLESINENLDIYNYNRRTLFDIAERKQSLESLYFTIDFASIIYWESQQAGIITAEEFWGLSEKYRSAYLKEYKYTEKLKSIYLGMPEKTKNKEQNLLDTLYTIQKNDSLKNNNRGEYFDKISSTLTKLHDYQQELGKQYPGYYKLRLEQKYPSIAQVQEQLDSSEVMVEFLHGNISDIMKGWYAFIISRDTFRIEKINIKTQNTKNLVNAYYQKLRLNPLEARNRQELLRTIKVIDSLGVRLRKSLFDSLDIYKYEKWILIPQKYLYYLPVSSLPIGNDLSTDLKLSTNRLRFIDRFQISYAFSAQWWFEGNNKSEPSNRIKGLALLPDQKADAPPIGFNEKKLLSTLDQWEKLFPSAGKTIENDLAEIDFDLLYIAAHSKYEEQEEETKIYFDAQNPISGREIRKWPLKGKKVVLASCESQLGPNSAAEGMLSMSYYLAAAGAHSITGTLWEVSDKVTEEILSPVNYATLNMSAEKILEKIRDYRSKETSFDQLPYFWAAFWTFEQNDVKESKTIYSQSKWAILIGLAFGYILIILFLIKTRKL